MYVPAGSALACGRKRVQRLLAWVFLVFLVSASAATRLWSVTFVSDITLIGVDASSTVPPAGSPVLFNETAVGANAPDLTLHFALANGVSISTVSVTPTYPAADFSVESPVPGTGGTTATVVVHFLPLVPGLRTALLTVTGSDSNSTCLVALAGTGDAPRVAFAPAAASAIGVTGASLHSPRQVAYDGLGSMYVADAGTGNQVVKLPVTGGAASAFNPQTTLSIPSGVAVDNAGNVYVADDSGGGRLIIYVQNHPGAGITIPGSGLAGPSALAYDPMTDKVYIADSGHSQVRVFNRTNGTYSTLTFSGSPTPTLSNALNGIAVGPDGSVYVADGGNTQVVKVTAGAGSVLGTGSLTLSSCDGVAVDRVGNVYIADTSRIVVVPSNAGSPFELTMQGLTTPLGTSPLQVAVDDSAHVLVSDPANSRLVQIDMAAAPNLVFADTLIGQTDGPKTVQVINLGNKTLNITEIDSIGFSPDFMLAAAPLSSLQQGESSTESLTFTPTSPASLNGVSGTRTFTDDNMNVIGAQQIITASGLGLQGDPTATATVTFSTPNSAAPVYGDAVTLTTTVTDTAQGTVSTTAAVVGGSQPTGSVSFFDGATLLGSGPLSSGVATFTTSSLEVGDHVITARYAGAPGSFLPSATTNTTTVHVSKATPVMILSSSLPNSSSVSQQVTFSIRLITPQGSDNGSYSGTVTLTEGANTLGSAQAAASLGISATFATADSHIIVATYSGDSHYNGLSRSLTQVVNNPATSTALTSSSSPLNTSAYASPVTFTATVTPSAATGTVSFMDGNSTLGPGTLTNGVWTFTTSTLAPGAHTITAAFVGTGSYSASTSAPLTQVVNTTTSTTLTSSPDPSPVRVPVTFTATVAAVGGTATGPVTFMDGSIVLGYGSLSGGVATFTTSALTAGAHAVTAVYGGATGYPGSRSPVRIQLVTMTLQASANPATAGATVQFTATVAAVGSTATGTVTFLDGLHVLATLPLSGGTARYSTTSLAVGSHAITAIYNGNATGLGGISFILNLTVNKVAGAVALTTSQNPEVAPSVTFRASVSDATGIIPTGTVTFKDGTTTLGSSSLSAGVATFTTSSLRRGTHSITAVYGGDAHVLGATSPVLSQVVNR